MVKELVARIMLSSLKKGFRRICWVGPEPIFEENLPIIAYANHHTFYDGYVMWLLAQQLLGRDTMLWMEDWDRFPFFAAAGAYPFPSDDPARRLATIRKTARRLATDPDSFLIYFPEGELHPPEAGLLPIDTNNLKRLDRIFPDKYWWPVSIHMTTRGETLPTLLLSGGTPHRTVTGQESDNLEAGLNFLKQQPHNCDKVLLEGKKSDDESWNMQFMSRWFSRYL